VSKQAQGPNQPSIQWVLGALSKGTKAQGREDEQSPLSRNEVKNCGAIPPLTPYLFLAWCSISYAQGQFYLYLLWPVSRKYAPHKYSRVVLSNHRRGLDWILDFLTTYRHEQELQAITAPPLISTIHKSPRHPLSLFHPAVSSPATPW
jgi:hypothetical protein